jgi:hypothetical protein
MRLGQTGQKTDWAQDAMKIDEIILREIDMGPFETSFATISGRRIALLEVRCDGVSGWGKCC